MANTVTVPVKPAAKSKINWAQIVSVGSLALAHFGFDLDPKTQVAVVTAIGSLTAVVTWVLRTWFNKTVTP